MKRIVSVSLGSSKRNHTSSIQVLGEDVVVERIGTDGDMRKAVALIRELDGKVDAFGMGGIDIYLYAAGRRYTFREARQLAEAARQTPIVDGSGLKGTLERRVVRYVDQQVMPLQGKRTLLNLAVDRYGMAEALVECGANIMFGDLMFGLGLDIPIWKLKTVGIVGRTLLPIMTQLPISWVYPTGAKQEVRQVKYPHRFQWAEVIAGDYHYIGRHMPDQMEGKLVLTNTVTPADVEDLQRRGVAILVTTTPNLGGRSFGTNLMEALIVAAAGKRSEALTPDDYEAWLDKLSFAPRVEHLNPVHSVAD